ncbi:MAG TPA: periplasmic heavy metal sensor [Thermoanaerobaculia bacterium]|nr:periplasmic heavy metal sensor [Thermoanaerobaculia bacterium]
MRRICLLAIATVILAAATLPAAELPPGKWWRRPAIVQMLNLSEEQQIRLDGIFRISANDLIDRRSEVQKQSIALRGELDQPQLNRQNIQKIASRLSEARARLFERELMMLVDMRAVLTETQWNRMRNVLDDEIKPQQRNPQRNPMRNQR